MPERDSWHIRLGHLGFAAPVLASLLLLTACRERTAFEVEGDDVTSVIQALVRASGATRPIEPRFCGGFVHRRCAPDPSEDPIPEPICPPAKISDDLYRQALTAARSRSAVLGKPIAEHLAAVAGVAMKAPRRDADLSPVVSALEEIGKKAPAEPCYRNDLAALLIHRAQRENRPADLVRALELTAGSPGASPLETQFNHALALEALALDEAAANSWREYLERESDPGWAGEGRDRLARLTRRPEPWREVTAELELAGLEGDLERIRGLAEARRQAARGYVERELLPRWARRVRSEGAAPELATTIRNLAAVLGELTHDPLLQQAVERGLVGKPEPFAGAVLAWDAGRRHYEDFEIERAEESLRRARATFSAAGNPLAGWCDYYLAACAYQGSELVEAREALDRLRIRARGAGYRTLAGSAARLSGLISAIVGEPSHALDAYLESLEELEVSGEEQELVAIYTGLAELMEILEGDEAAWRYYHLALRGAARIDQPLAVYRAASPAASLALSSGRPVAAGHLLEAALGAARRLGNPAVVTGALRRRALLLHRRGREVEAAGTLAEARRVASRVSDDGVRQTLLGDLAVVEGQIALDDPSRDAVEPWTRVLEDHRRSGFRLALAQALLGRGRAWLATGEVDRAEEDLAAGIATVESVRARLTDGSHRSIYLGSSRALFDEMIRLQIDHRQRPEAALAYAEAAQARVLLDWRRATPTVGEELRLPPGAASPRNPESIRRGLGTGERLLEYWILADRLLILEVGVEGVVAEQVAVSADALAAEVTGLRRAVLAGDAAGIRERGAVLYDALVRPIAGRLEPEARLVLVPDGVLDALPFAALWDAERGRYLVELHELILAPSASLAIRAPRRRSHGDTAGTPALVVGDPAFARRLSPLPRLPEAAEEARAVASFHPGARLLLGEEATRREFMALAPEAAVIHFAGHAEASPDQPLHSRLLLAPTADGSDPGLLFLRDLLAHRFDRTELVVLSACKTAESAGRGPIGPASFARAFLATGVPVVVASLWQVDDRASRWLMTRFHEKLAANQRVAQALREAQIEALRGERRGDHSGPGIAGRVEAWAAFQVYGAEADRDPRF